MFEDHACEPVPTSALQAKMEQPMDMISKLKYEKTSLEHRLQAVNAAIAALEKSPEVMEAINCISKVRGIGY